MHPPCTSISWPITAQTSQLSQGFSLGSLPFANLLPPGSQQYPPRSVRESYSQAKNKMRPLFRRRAPTASPFWSICSEKASACTECAKEKQSRAAQPLSPYCPPFPRSLQNQNTVGLIGLHQEGKGAIQRLILRKSIEIKCLENVILTSSIVLFTGYVFHPT